MIKFEFNNWSLIKIRQERKDVISSSISCESNAVNISEQI